ncbi:DUF6115 domain-containing protein [Peribacillus sp. NPDC097675]|uniref:DUF6115 domain-containing protein n=1 Tax=Peribacillus sp. NPDC097675 TaxID=3390618 RepID=UPI003D070209
MSGIFMFLLFSLNIFTIFAVIVLYLRQNRLSKLEKEQKAVIMEMEELLTGYLMEMKEDNEALIKAVTQAGAKTNQNRIKEQVIVKSRSVVKEAAPSEELMPLLKEPSLTGAKKQAANAYKNQSETDGEFKPADGVKDKLELSSDASGLLSKEIAQVVEKDFSAMLQDSLEELSLNEQVDYLREQGLSIEEIAKKLNRGQTEIELLLKFKMNR